jgi:uncharacterized metal-binding protein YceD (DUF177 family)
VFKKRKSVLMSRTPPSATALRVSDLSQTEANSFALRPEADVLASIAEELEISALRKLSFAGAVTPLGKQDWQLNGKLGATVVQPCVVTLEPVTTRIDVSVTRHFVRDFEEPDEEEIEMPEDDNSEPLGKWIDPAQVMIEALALEVPEYPRKGDAELGSMVLTEPGQKPMTDEDARPFAGLGALRDALKNDES